MELPPGDEKEKNQSWKGPRAGHCWLKALRGQRLCCTLEEQKAGRVAVREVMLGAGL